MLTDGTTLAPEPAFPFTHLFPGQLASVNRFVSIDGTVKQRLVVVPAQYQANPGETVGTERRYDQLDLDCADRAGYRDRLPGSCDP